MKVMANSKERKMSWSYVLAPLFAITTVFTQAEARPLTEAEKSCVFKKPVVVGASISAETAQWLSLSLPVVGVFPSPIPNGFGPYYLLTSSLAASRGVFLLPRFGGSPIKALLRDYAHTGVFNTGEVDYSKMFTRDNGDLGSAQIQELLGGAHKSVFANASVIFAIDAFYWDAIYNNCGLGNGEGVEATIKTLTSEAAVKNIKLFLGKVPYEDPKTVLIDSARLGFPGLWYQPTPECVKSINTTIDSFCRTDQGCYKVDLNDMAQRLIDGEKLSLKDGSTHDLYSMRPDGVHVSIYGTTYVKEQMIQALEKSPPKCN